MSLVFKIGRHLILVQIFMVCAGIQIFGQTMVPYYLKGEEYNVNLANFSLYYYDRYKTLEGNEILSGRKNDLFSSYENTEFPSVVNWTQGDLWVMFEIYNATSKDISVVLDGVIEQDSIFIKSQDLTEKFAINASDSDMNYVRGKISGPNRFFMTLKANQKYQFLVKQNHQIYNLSDAQIRVSDLLTYETNYYAEYYWLTQFFLFGFGFVVTLIVLILINYIFFKKKELLLYLIYLLSVSWVIWRNFEWFDLYSRYTIQIIPWVWSKNIEISLVFLTYVWFIMYLLDFKVYKAGLTLKVYSIFFMAVMVLEIPINWFYPHISFFIYKYLTIVIAFFSLLILLSVWNTPHKYAKWVFTGTALLIISKICSALFQNYFAVVLPTLGVILEVGVLSVIVIMWLYDVIKIQYNSIEEKNRLIAEKNALISKMRKNFAEEIQEEVGESVDQLSLLTYFQLAESGDDPKFIDKVISRTKKIAFDIKDMIWLIDDQVINFGQFQSFLRYRISELAADLNANIDFYLPERNGEMLLDADEKRKVYSLVKLIVEMILKEDSANKIQITCELKDQMTITIKCTYNFSKILDYYKIKRIIQHIESNKGKIQMDSDNELKVFINVQTLV